MSVARPDRTNACSASVVAALLLAAAPLFGAQSLGLTLLMTFGQLGIFVVVMFVGGRRLFPTELVDAAAAAFLRSLRP